MTTRADLIETAYGALTAQGLIQHAQIRHRVAEVVLDALLPQITTAEQLDDYSDGTLLIDEPASRILTLSSPWLTEPKAASDELALWLIRHALERFGPLTVVWQPQPEQETRTDA